MFYWKGNDENMGLYFENFTLKQKLFELAELSAKKKILQEHLNIENNDLYIKLISGEINNVLEASNLVDEVIKSLN